jgi:hypothetical protein
MGPHHALRISPRFDATYWQRLNLDEETDWPRAVEVFRDRIEGRFVRYANDLLKDLSSGFVVLAIDAIVAETLEQFIQGVGETPWKKGEDYFVSLLTGRFFPEGFDKETASRFYTEIRCGLLHQAETKGQTLVRRGREKMVEKTSDGIGMIIDVVKFHESLRTAIDAYGKALVEAGEADLRKKFWNKMDGIARIRENRVALF